MRDRFNMLALKAAVVLVLFSVAVGCVGPAAAKKKDKWKAQPITTANADQLETLLKKAEGTVVVLNFWATWCPPCVAEMPEFSEFYRTTKRKEVTVISLSADDKGTIDTAVKKFQEEQQLPFPIHILAETDIDKLSEAFKTEVSGALPSTYIYDRKGDLHKVIQGTTTLEALGEITKSLL